MMEAILIHPKLDSGMRDVPLAYVVRLHTKVVHILHEYDVYKGMVARAPLVNTKLKLMKNQDHHDTAYVSWQ